MHSFRNEYMRCISCIKYTILQSVPKKRTFRTVLLLLLLLPYWISWGIEYRDSIFWGRSHAQGSESAFFGTPCTCMYPIIRNSVQILPRGTANWCVSVLTKLTFHMRGIVAQKLVRNIGQCASCRWWKTIISQTLVPMKMAAWINFLGNNAVATLSMAEGILQFTKNDNIF